MSSGSVRSDGIDIFYRRFGQDGGGTPMLILHGANYFDSADWVTVGTALGVDRAIVAIDQRGFGRSGWSADKDYSNAAQLRDMTAVLDHLGWARAAILGHSRGGIHAILFAGRQPDRCAALILGDSSPGGVPPPAEPRINVPPRVFPTLETLAVATSRASTPPARLAEFTAAVDGGYILSRRDPDFGNTPGPADDLWAALAAVRAPVLLVRGAASNRLAAADIERMRAAVPDLREAAIDAGHDLAAMAPDALTAAVRHFLRENVD